MSAFKSLAVAVAVSAMLVNAQIPPNFTPSASQQLGVAYGPGSSNTRIITPGLRIDQSSKPPTKLPSGKPPSHEKMDR